MELLPTAAIGKELMLWITVAGSLAAAVFSFLSWRAARMTSINEWIRSFSDIVDREIKGLDYGMELTGRGYTIAFRIIYFYPKESESKLYKFIRLLGGRLKGDLELDVTVMVGSGELFEKESEFIESLKKNLELEFKEVWIEEWKREGTIGYLRIRLISELKDSAAESYKFYVERFVKAVEKALSTLKSETTS